MIASLWLAALLCASGASAEERALPPPPAVSTATRHLDFVADHADYDAAKALIHLRGHVRIVESTWTVKGDDVWLDTRRRLGRSQGYLLVEDKMSAVYGDSGEFDFQNRTGTLYRASAGHGDWRIHGGRVRMSEKRRLDYYSADFTSCDYVPPHYHFHATHITVVPRKYLLARNTVFYLGEIPLFYTPVLYKSLAEEHFLRFKVQPGYDRRNGVFAKSTLTTEHTPFFSSKLYIDYYSAQGLGTGAELNRHGGTDSRGAVYGYRIRESSTGQERWTLLGSGYQGFLSSASAQARLQVQSDAAFNNDYARASLFRVTPELINNGAVNYRLKRSTLRLSYSRDDSAAGDGTKFIKQTESYPRIDWLTQPIAFKGLPWLNTLSAFADNTYEVGRPFIQKSGGAGWEGTRTIALGRGLALTPKLDYNQTFYNRFDEQADGQSTSTVLDSFIGHYTAAPDLRVPTPIGAFDLIQAYAVRQKPGTLQDDSGAPDHGVESNLTSIEDSFSPARRVRVRLFTGYDERVFRGYTVGFRDRVQPFVADVYYAPRSDIDLSLRQDYQLNQGERSFIFNAQRGETASGRYIGLGAGYTRASSDQYFASTDFGWAPTSSTWRASGSLRCLAVTESGPAGLSRLRLFEKEFTLTKLWHDFYTRAQLRFRPGGVREITVRIDLKFGSMSKDAAKRRDWEAEWFPERQSAMTERP